MARRQRDQPPDRWDREPLNAAYARLIETLDALAKRRKASPATKDASQTQSEQTSFNGSDPAWNRIERQLEEITTLLEQRLTGKLGLIRRDGLGRRVDWSGRFVIAPDPDMDWDACGVPTAALVILLGARVGQWSGLEDAVECAAQRQCEEAPDSFDEPARAVLARLADPDTWRHPAPLDVLQRRRSELPLMRFTLLEWLKAHSDTWVLLNRQPSLHRYSIMAFHPCPLPPEDGLVMRIHPLVCKGFGADFDGDEMALHLPLGEAERQEAAHLAPTRHLLSVADGEPVPAFDQDFVLGHYLLSRTERGRVELGELLGVAGCPGCETLWSVPSPWDKNHGGKVMKHLCGDHPDLAAERIPDWMRRMGVRGFFLEFSMV